MIEPPMRNLRVGRVVIHLLFVFMSGVLLVVFVPSGIARANNEARATQAQNLKMAQKYWGNKALATIDGIQGPLDVGWIRYQMIVDLSSNPADFQHAMVEPTLAGDREPMVQGAKVWMWVYNPTAPPKFDDTADGIYLAAESAPNAAPWLRYVLPAPRPGIAAIALATVTLWIVTGPVDILFLGFAALWFIVARQMNYSVRRRRGLPATPS